MTRPIIF